MRNLAAQVPEAVGRLLHAQVINPPVWHQPALSHPPIPLPPRRVAPSAFGYPRAPPIPSSSTADPAAAAAQQGAALDIGGRAIKLRNNAQKHLRTRRPRVREVTYDEDAVRRRFFADFPFEALRPVSLVEGRVVREEEQVRGEAWYELAQRGEYPSVENTIAFITNLHQAFHISLSQAYAKGVEQFVRLRAVHEVATLAAEQEARHRGHVYKKDVFDRFVELENAALRSFAPSSTSSTGSASTRRAWSQTLSPAQQTHGKFAGGIDYANAWTRWERHEARRREAEEGEREAREAQRSLGEQVRGEEARE